MDDVEEGGAAMLPEIEHRLAELSAELEATDADAEAERLTEEMGNLRRVRREARATAPRVVQREVRSTQRFGADWAEAETVEERRGVLVGIVVRRGRTGRGLDTSRLTFKWKMPEQVGPIEVPDDETLAA
ncbi:hypothetical protein [Occultella kanbiaonis]|uniref:hypothetical protein n=1 Tax=Occultella kanbiaonis TaxID=2675754 RepID=UPI00143DA165|nr:hypothetical protein [Occultella kanbiaonis]